MLETQSLSAQILRILFTKSHPPEKTGFPCGTTVKNLPGMQEKWVDPWVGEIPWRMVWKSAPDSCLRNPMDAEAWQATVYGVANNWTRLND